MATGTKLMKEISDQFLICKICLETFKEPKTLSCLHTFCCGCIQQQYDAESSRPTRYTLYTRCVTCPLCRKKTDLPTGGVRRLPDNFLVSNLTEVLAKRCMSKVPPCEICHTVRPRSNEACSKCLDCDKLLCPSCVDLHSTTKVTQDHSLIDLEGQKDIECKVHPQETVRFYCEKCEECICVVCTFQEHKDHDVCSFNDGFAKHKVTLESLLSRSKERLTDMASRLKVIEKYEVLSKELKERIRDLAISYTSQVRAREKELIKQVEELFSEEVVQLAENKSWLQENFDNLQSTCNLTEIVMKDKGVEMLLLKKEIQGKMDVLLDGVLPPEPPDLQQLDVKFVPGEVKLGDVFIPGSREADEKALELKKTLLDKIVTNGLSKEDSKAGIFAHNGDITKDSGGKPCADCVARKLKDAEEKRAKKRKAQEGEKWGTKSVYIQTKPPDEADNRNTFFTTAASQVSLTPSGVSLSHNSMQTHTTAMSLRDAATDSNSTNNKTSHVQYPSNETRETMTDRRHVRTLKTQTEDSCLRDTHLGQAAATGSTYPNTGAAIAAAFLRHKVTDDDPYGGQSVQPAVRESYGCVEVDKATQDAVVATDISLGVSEGNMVLTIAKLCGGAEDVTKGINGGTDSSRPDLLAETGTAATSPHPSPSFTKIRSRKVQTEISALDHCAEKDGSLGEKAVMDSAMKRCLFAASSSRPLSANHADAASSPLRFPTVAKSDVGVMTPFRVKLVQDTVDKGTFSEAVESNSVGLMTSPETRTVYIQTRGPRVASTATGTDFEGQMSKSTSTLYVTSVDAETAMPQKSYESRMTWTEALVTSERATCTASSSTSDAATLTSQVQKSDFAVQMRPVGVAACTTTVPPKLVHHHCQTTPSVCHKTTMPDPKLQAPEKPANHQLSSAASALKPLPWPAPAKPVPSPAQYPPVAAISEASVVTKSDKATETAAVRSVTRAAGPNVQMLSSRTTSTDTVSLLQVTDKETGTPTIKTADGWTHTPQPQMINTGVTPPRPAVLEVGVATVPITLMDQATYTEVTTVRECGTETAMLVCDSETLTDRTLMCDAQTEVETMTESQGTEMELVEQANTGSMTEEVTENLPILCKELAESGIQCQTPELLNKEVNTSRQRRRAKEVQTSFSYTECLLCQHPERLEQLELSRNKTFSDTSTDPSPPDTQDVGTMALSCLPSCPGLMHAGVQTAVATLYDKGVATSFELDEEQTAKPFLGLESQDAATSTESLPYIGLLSEIDVDELIVIPEANFELVSDIDLYENPVEMTDNETWTETLDYAEVGTQTLPLSTGTDTSEDQMFIQHEDDCSKNVASIGVNTLPKVTFEKETTTPIQHLFSKGTMTFYVTKMDKSTSTISYTRPKAESVSGEASGGVGAGRLGKEANKQKKMDNKVTMTNRAEQRDMAVETDPALVDGRITQCITKLRNVSERLNSPTNRRHMEEEMPPAQSTAISQQEDTSIPASSAVKTLSNTLQLPVNDAIPSQPTYNEEQDRKTQFQSLLLEANTALRPKDPSPVRKPQPITTLKPRTPVTPGDVTSYDSKSLPRKFSADRQNKVKMGSQATPPCRLPLLRYNSAPDRIASMPAQTLMCTPGSTSPRTSPTKFPISLKPTIITHETVSSDSGPESDAGCSPSSQKVQQRPSLPSITETRTPSSCSESSFISMESADSSLNAASAMASSHSRTPSNVTSVSDTPSDVTHPKHSSEHGLADMDGEGDNISTSSTSTTLAVTPSPQNMSSSSESLSKQKKEKKGFMQRLLSVKKKKKEGSNEKDVAAKEGTNPSQQTQQKKLQPSAVVPPPSPRVPKKLTGSQPPAPGARPKQPLKSAPTTSSAAQGNLGRKPPSPISTPPVSRPVSTGSGPPAHHPPPHNYPPLPDPSKSPPVPKKPQPFVYVRQRIMSIQQDNVEEVQEKKEKEKEEKEEKGKEEKEKGKVGEKGRSVETTGAKVKEQASARLKEKKPEKAQAAVRGKGTTATGDKGVKEKAVGVAAGKGVKDKGSKEAKGVVGKGRGIKLVTKTEKAKDPKADKPADKKAGRKPRDATCSQ